MRQVQIVDLAGSERLKPYEDGSQQDKARDGDGELVKQGIFLGFFCWIYSGFIVDLPIENDDLMGFYWVTLWL
jgi:hypothetical protein